MNRLVAMTLFVLIPTVANLRAEGPVQVKTRPVASYGKLPLTFEPNQGQARPGVQFLSHGQGYTLALSPGEASLALAGAPATQRKAAKAFRSSLPLRIQLSGSNSKATASWEDEQITRTNYLIGNDPAKWHTGVANYARVRYTGIYPGIDLVYYGNQRHLEHDFIVAPNADPDKIVLSFSNNQRISIEHATGDLLLKTSQGEVRLHKPVTYQQPDGKRAEIASSYRLLGRNRAAFRLGSYDHRQPLIIDPVLTYSTYLGGSGNFPEIPEGDLATAIAADASGNAYVTGYTQSSDFPITSGAYQITNSAAAQYPHQNVFVSKLNPTGTALLYSTYLGGSDTTLAPYTGGDYATSIAIDSDGNAYIAGYTSSADFPTTPGAFQAVNYNQLSGVVPASTGFITKLNASGTALVYSTYLGGHAQPTHGIGERIYGIALDSANNAYVTGATPSSDFPVTAGAYQQATAALNFTANFVSKLNSTGTALVYSTFLDAPVGGFGQSLGYPNTGAIAVDRFGSAYIAGNTIEADFPVTSGAFDTHFAYTGFDYAYGEPFVTKLSPDGSSLVYSTYFGGRYVYNSNVYNVDGDFVTALQVDSDGNAFIAGTAASYNFPIVGGLLETISTNASGFVAKLNSTGSAVDFSTLIGGDNSTVTALAIDGEGHAFITGTAYPQNLPVTPDGMLLNQRGAFYAKLNSTGNAIQYATMFGGSGNTFGADTAFAAAVSPSGTAYFAGVTHSSDMPVTSGAFQTTNKRSDPYGFNAFVTALPLASETTDHFPSQIGFSNASPAIAKGSAGTLTATVSSTASEIATGSITFFTAASSPNSFPAQTVALDGTGNAAFNASALPEGKYIVYATYMGDATHLSINSLNQSGGTVNVTVVGGATNASWAPYTPSSLDYGFISTSAFQAAVQVTDAVGDPVSGISVSFSGTGFVYSPATTTTDSNGFAQTDVTVHKAGNLALIATVQGIATPVTHDLLVTPAPLTLTLGSNFRTYGAPNPAFPYRISGLVGSDTVTVNTFSNAIASSAPGNYPASATISGPVAANYTLTVTPYPGILLIIKAPLRLQPPSYVVNYGEPIPALGTYSLTGFVNGDTHASSVTGTPIITTNATNSSAVGLYRVNIDVGTLASANYTFRPFANNLQIYPRHITIRPDSFNIHVGDPMPALTYTLSGYLPGDTAASTTTGAPVLTANTTTTAKPGRYFIVAQSGTLRAQNYVFDYPIPSTYGVLSIYP
jgi:hypothetical protein